MNTNEHAFKMMAQDFLQMCPIMKSVAIDEIALIARYEGYSAHGKRPSLPIFSTNEQQAQRDKLIELAQEWVEAETDYWRRGASGYAQSQINSAKQEFRDYVEHMHDELAQSLEIATNE